MARQTLLLNAWMLPLRVVSWQEAITLWYLGKVDVLEAYDDCVSSPSVTLQIPAVVRLRRLIHHVRRGVKFSRANVFGRDGYRCQYCGVRKPRSELSFDHVVPRMAGGRTGWDNIVTACRPCNHKKRNRTPEQADMLLLRKPTRPATLPVAAFGLGQAELPKEWADYCVPVR